MVVDPTILPESLAPSLVMVIPVAQTRKQAMLSVMVDHVVPLTKQAFLFCDGRPTKDAGSSVSGGRPCNTTSPVAA